MAARTSIELHEHECRVVELQLPGRARIAIDGARARTYATGLPGAADPLALEQALRELRRLRRMTRDCCVTLWGLGSFHRLLQLPYEPDGDLEDRARAAIADDLAIVEARVGQMAVALEPGREREADGVRRREISVVTAPESAIADRLLPIEKSGFVVTRVLTPSLALGAVARRRSDTMPGSAVAYVAVEARETCLAIVRDGVVLLAREIAWGHAQADETAGTLHEWLAAELRRSMLLFRQTFRTPVEAVALCGDVPRLRTLTRPLGEALKVPIETLDALTGIDATKLPDPADEFRQQMPALRLAIDAGLDPSAAASLRAAAPHGRARTFVLAAVGVCVVVALTYLGWTWMKPSTEVGQRAAPSGASPSAGAVTAGGGAAPPAPAAPSVVAPPVAAPPPPAPFDGGLSETVDVSSILYSPERKLAIINGRIARVGDRVGTSTVFDIQPRAVVMESADGRRWTIQLRDRARGESVP